MNEETSYSGTPWGMHGIYANTTGSTITSSTSWTYPASTSANDKIDEILKRVKEIEGDSTKDLREQLELAQDNERELMRRLMSLEEDVEIIRRARHYLNAQERAAVDRILEKINIEDLI